MEFKEYNYIDKNGNSNCVIRSLSKMYNIDYEEVENDLKELASNLNKNYNDIEVFEQYMKYKHTHFINYGKDIQIKDLNLNDGKYIVLCYDKKDFYHMVYIDNGILYDKSDKSLDLYAINVYKFNTLELYKEWFENYSFFGGNSFVLDEIKFLWKAINIIGPDFKYSNDFKINSFSNLGKEENILLAQKYFNNHNIKIDINEKIKNNELELIESNKEEWYSSFDEEKNKIHASVSLSNTVMDGVIIVHELTHNRNQPYGKRNVTSDLITEGISYVNEMIAVDELFDDFNKENFFKGFQKMAYNYAYGLFEIYQVILTYKHQNDITEEKYKLEFKNNNYKDVMNIFDKFVETKQQVFKMSYYILGFMLSTYMFMEYKKDDKFFNKIEELNNSINDLKFKECLNIIGIKNLDDLLVKFADSNKEFIEYSDKIYSKNKKI